MSMLRNPDKLLNRAYRAVGKRARDLVLAVLALWVALPLVAAVGVAVRANLGAPILFRHRRPASRRAVELLKFALAALPAPRPIIVVSSRPARRGRPSARDHASTAAARAGARGRRGLRAGSSRSCSACPPPRPRTRGATAGSRWRYDAAVSSTGRPSRGQRAKRARP